jgi:threonine synthase
MRAVIFVSTACQPEKPALITQAGAWVFQAFEVWEQLGRRLPDLMVAPVGDGPTLVALDKGHRRARQLWPGRAASPPGRG